MGVRIRRGLLVGLALGLAAAGPAAGQDVPDQIEIQLNQWEGEDVRGSATLTADGDRTVVEIEVVGVTGKHPDHIHRSTCDDPEPVPTYPLRDVVLNETDDRGRSRTVVDVSLADLLEDDYLILIHKSHEELDVYVACGDIAYSASTLGGTGAGPAAVAARAWPPAAVGGTAVLLLAAGTLALRRGASRRAA